PLLLPFPPSQGMDSLYANGAYSTLYPAAAPHYAGPPQARAYCSSGPPHSPYPAPLPPPVGCWVLGGFLSPPAGPACSCKNLVTPGPSPLSLQTPGMPAPQYPYGDSPRASPQPRPQEEAWAPPAACGVQPRYTWPVAPPYGNPFLSESHPAWTGSGAASHPPTRDPKETTYDKPEQSAEQHSYYSSVNHQHSGTTSEHRPPKPSPPNPKVQYSAQPQMYNSAARKLTAGSQEADFRAGDHASADSAAIPPEIQRIWHVTGEAERLEEEVDEFVGKKTDKSYRLLEEMLTKLLLELDSIETGGQDGVRQARKEAVHRIQAILEKLERKGL
ncbi:BAG4 regulator, partial [Alectura lathami]|nr:BAG4 regulator [Alectura lathami]